MKISTFSSKGAEHTSVTRGRERASINLSGTVRVLARPDRRHGVVVLIRSKGKQPRLEVDGQFHRDANIFHLLPNASMAIFARRRMASGNMQVEAQIQAPRR